MIQIKLENFAKIKNTTVEINDITVVAGKPSTGKSFFMKFCYAILESHVKTERGDIVKDFFYSKERNFDFWKVYLNEFLADIEKTKSDKELTVKKMTAADTFQKSINEHDYVKALELYKQLSESNHNTLELLNQKINEQKDILSGSSKEHLEFYIRNILQSIFRDLNQINNKFSVTFDTFQVNFFENKINIENEKPLGSISNIVFVETPLILEFEKFMTKEKFKTPYHIESLLNQLEENYAFTDTNENQFISDFNQKISEIINGKMEKSAKGFIFTNREGKDFDIVNVSSGVKSLGLLQYLVNNKILKPRSVLFWEEPEVHLHPTWQIKMADLFLYMMEQDIKIIFSTHSPYICDYLNAVSQKKDLRNRISFNLFSQNSIDEVKNDVLIKENWKNIQDELLEPLEEIMWEYL
jgi:predicted ATPase